MEKNDLNRRLSVIESKVKQLEKTIALVAISLFILALTFIIMILKQIGVI